MGFSIYNLVRRQGLRKKIRKKLTVIYFRVRINYSNNYSGINKIKYILNLSRILIFKLADVKPPFRAKTLKKKFICIVFAKIWLNYNNFRFRAINYNKKNKRTINIKYLD